MSSESEEGEFWLPAEFLDEHFFLDETQWGETKMKGLIAENPSSSPTESATETESDEEDSIAGLTRKMARHFLHEEKMPFLSNMKVMATSPQSPLRDAGIWSVSSRWSTKRPLQVPSLPSAPLEYGKDLLYTAPGERMKMKETEEWVPRFGLLHPAKKLSTGGFDNNSILTHQQIQAAQFYQLKRQQLIKQQLSAAWSRQMQAVMAARGGQPVGMAQASALRQPPAAGMRAVFLNSSGARRESTGTGVFFPRQVCAPNEPTKKPSCSTVLLPARVVQALNLDDILVQRQHTGFYSLDHEACVGFALPGRRHQYPTPVTVAGNETRLPPEWTY